MTTKSVMKLVAAGTVYSDVEASVFALIPVTTAALNVQKVGVHRLIPLTCVLSAISVVLLAPTHCLTLLVPSCTITSPLVVKGSSALNAAVWVICQVHQLSIATVQVTLLAVPVVF